jgi:hypothetical protein
METWKPVPEFEALYEVSNFGNVRRIARGKRLDGVRVAEAKRMLGEGALLREVADFLGTSVATASNIKRGVVWAGDEGHRLLKPRPIKGYLHVDLCCDGKAARRVVHRLVWETFVGPIIGRLEINHKNLDRADNRLENLDLVTHRQNLQHAIDAYKSQGLLRAVKGVKGFIVGKHSHYDNR